MTDSKTPIILSYGMGVDSTAILLRWILEPASRDFELEDLVVLTSQVGNEFPDTKKLLEEHILPLLREHGIRYVQVARKGPSLKEGEVYVVLSDTDEPTEVLLEGQYTLSDELTSAGTVPQFTVGNRRCSIKFKGVVLDAWIHDSFPGTEYKHIIGFNADELKRVERDKSFATDYRNVSYPLVDWGWGREKCEQYIEEVLGVAWKKSCCSFCPFSNGKGEILDRYQDHPEAAAEAMLLERVSTALNPRMTLYPKKSVETCVRDDGNEDAVGNLEEVLAEEEWAVYRVRRIYWKKQRADRKVEGLHRGDREEIEARLAEMAAESGQPVTEVARSNRIYLAERQEDVYPTIEDMLVAAPGLVKDKAKKSFDGNWDSVLSGDIESVTTSMLESNSGGNASEEVLTFAVKVDAEGKPLAVSLPEGKALKEYDSGLIRRVKSWLKSNGFSYRFHERLWMTAA